MVSELFTWSSWTRNGDKSKRIIALCIVSCLGMAANCTRGFGSLVRRKARLFLLFQTHFAGEANTVQEPFRIPSYEHFFEEILNFTSSFAQVSAVKFKLWKPLIFFGEIASSEFRIFLGNVQISCDVLKP